MTEAELLLPRVARGDRAAMGGCIRQYGPLVWAIALRMLPSRAEAEDAVQETFIAVWQSAGRFDPARASERTFVAMIARRRMIDRRRASSRHEWEDDDTLATLPSSDHLAMEWATDAKQAAIALAKLPEDKQRVIRLAVFEGMSHDEIAKSTGIPLGTVKSHVRRGLSAVRDALLGTRSETEGRVQR